MSEFKTYHPIVNFTYFLFVIAFSCFFMHPVALSISAFSGFSYSFMTGGKKALKSNIAYIFIIVLLTGLVNPLFNHEGVTILTYFKNGNPLTLESILYGIASGFMIVSVIWHFSCYNRIMTSDKFIYLFGKIIPSLSLVFSMVLRFVPKFKKDLSHIRTAQKCIGHDTSNGNFLTRIKNGMRIISALILLSLENSIETADSMKSRGYGLPGRTAYSNFTFSNRDKKALFFIFASGLYTMFGCFCGKVSFRYFPSFSISEISVFNISVFTAYAILCTTPIIIECWEALKWKSLKQKI